MSYDEEEVLKEDELDASEEVDLDDAIEDAVVDEEADDDIFSEEDEELGEEFAGLDGSAADYL